MTRWRTVGFIGEPTSDGRVIRGRVSVREPEVPLRVIAEGDGHAGVETVGTAAVRVVGNTIQARLPWRFRRANLDLASFDVQYEDGLCTIIDPTVIALTVAGPNAWEALR